MKMRKERDMFFYLGNLMRLTNRISSKHMSREGIDITSQQAFILFELEEKDGLSQQDLARLTAKDRTSITRLIDNMVKRELVSRISDTNDRRIKRIYRTSKSKQIIKQVMKGGKTFQNKLLKDIEKEKADIWFEVMKHFIEKCRKEEKELDQTMKK